MRVVAHRAPPPSAGLRTHRPGTGAWRRGRGRWPCARCPPWSCRPSPASRCHTSRRCAAHAPAAPPRPASGRAALVPTFWSPPPCPEPAGANKLQQSLPAGHAHTPAAPAAAVAQALAQDMRVPEHTTRGASPGSEEDGRVKELQSCQAKTIRGSAFSALCTSTAPRSRAKMACSLVFLCRHTTGAN